MGKVYETPLDKDFQTLGSQTAAIIWEQALRAIYPIQRNQCPFPTYRINLVINTIICICITTVSTFLPPPKYILIGITFGMFFYVYSNFKWTLTKDVSPYLVTNEE